MSAITSMGEVDPITVDDLAQLAAVAEGPCLSVLLPTHRSGPATLQDPKRLRNLLDRAGELGASADLLRPMYELHDDEEFWQHQAEGLALYSGSGVFRSHRLSEAPSEEVHVAATFRVRPIVGLVSDHDGFRILALSQNAVRLFQASRYRVDELELDGVPRSLSEALAYEESNPRMHRSAGAEGQFHGHGAAEELDKAELERYFRAVDHAIHDRLGVSELPLVLASVGYYQPIFASVSTAHPEVLGEVAEGNPERRSPAELHREAWSIVERVRSSAGSSAWNRFQDTAGTGLTVDDLPGVVLAAAHGRVDTLFVAPGPPMPGSIDLETSTVRVADSGVESGQFPLDLVDRAVLDTIRHGGAVSGVDAGALPDGSEVAALLRY